MATQGRVAIAIASSLKTRAVSRARDPLYLIGIDEVSEATPRLR